MLILVTNLLPVDQVAIRLADEGVPLQVIARTLHAPSEEIRRRLRAAKDDGTLVDLPKEDWPPGFPRDQRALQLSRMVASDRAAVALAVQRLLRLTSTETALFMLLLTSATVPKERINLGSNRTIDVHICNLRRRIEPFELAITTLWGYGYQLSVDSRKRVLDLILEHNEQAA